MKKETKEKNIEPRHPQDGFQPPVMPVERRIEKYL